MSRSGKFISLGLILSFVLAACGEDVNDPGASSTQLVVPSDTSFQVSHGSGDESDVVQVALLLSVSQDDWTLTGTVVASGDEDVVSCFADIVSASQGSTIAAHRPNVDGLAIESSVWRSQESLSLACRNEGVGDDLWTAQISLSYDAGSMSECLESRAPRGCVGNELQATVQGIRSIPVLVIRAGEEVVSSQVGTVTE